MVDLEKERKAFEEWYTKLNNFPDFVADSVFAADSDDYRKYHNHHTEESFFIWKSLKAEIDSLKAKLERINNVWISVDFMLPDEGERVLVAIGDAQIVAEKCNVFGFIDVIDREALRTDLITHWMPLPQSPVVKSQGDGDE